MPENSLPPDAGITLDGVRVVSVDVRWNAGSQTALAERVGVAAMPLVRDRVESREHVVFSNQPATPDESTRLGASDGVVEVDLAAAPSDVERVIVLVFMQPRANAAKRTLDELSGLTVTLRDDMTGQELGQSVDLASDIGPVAAAVVTEIVREGSTWHAQISARGFEAGLDGALQMAGSRL